MLVVVLSLAALWSEHAMAQSQVHRCTTARGNTVYTDRRCDDIGASDRVPRGLPSGGARMRPGCSRNLRELMYEITAAIDNRDVNRLGGVYHWVGQNEESGYRILDQLQAVVDRPLVDIVAIGGGWTSPSLPDDAETADAPALQSQAPINDAPGRPATANAPDAGATGGRNAAQATSMQIPIPRRLPPTGLRLEQTLRNSATPTHTVFGLRRHLDCWWISF